MIIPDINMVVYAHNEIAPEYPSALSWWLDLLDGDEEIGLPWIVIAGFVRIMTNPRAMSSPLTPLEAMDRVADWLSRPHVHLIEPRTNHFNVFRRNLAVLSSGGNNVPDAQLAAFAIERGAELHTNDNGFGRFPGLRWRNPLRDN